MSGYPHSQKGFNKDSNRNPTELEQSSVFTPELGHVTEPNSFHFENLTSSVNDSSRKPNKFVPPRIEEIRTASSSLPRSAMNSPRLSPTRPGTPINPEEDGRVSPTSLAQVMESQDPHHLLDIVKNLVRTRHGSVLSRNTILKMDHFEKGVNTKLDFHLQGAPNFRVAALNVYGVAQPTANGLSTVLTLLNCHPCSTLKNSCTWFLTREEPLIYLNGNPYVLRDYANPLHNMVSFLGINGNRLEKLEERLKADVLSEAKSLNGLILVHQELTDGTIVPCFIAADQIQTPRELFEEFSNKNYRLKYFRIPISPEQAPEDNYFDEYVRVIKTLKPTDPLIFNCGMGVIRTTVGIVIAQVIRRAQLLEMNAPDPFPLPGWVYSELPQNNQNTRLVENIANGLLKDWEEVDSMEQKNHALLRLVYILEQGLDSKMSSKSAVEWALERGNLIERLKEAIMGNYNVITSLTAVLDSGNFSKRLMDNIIDQSDAVVNLREDILMNRIKQTTQHQKSSDYASTDNFISKAVAGLHRYFSLLCFTAYINESSDTDFGVKFSEWLRSRSEIWTMLQTIRRKGSKLYLLRPVEDLHRLRISNNSHNILVNGRFGRNRLGSSPGMFEMTGAGGQLGSVASEVEEFILKSRTGVVLTSQTILKVDFWNHANDQFDAEEHNQLQKLPTPGGVSTEEDDCNEAVNKRRQRHHIFLVEGGSNFRRIKHTHIYGIAQPTVDGLRSVLRRLLHDQPKNDKILWINLREEPIIYINGIPYVLRDRYFTLRNIRVYKGITGARLEQLEERLKQDVIREITYHEGRILLHGEDEEGNVLAAWEEVNVNDVMTVREVMMMAAAGITEELQSESSNEDNKRDDLSDRGKYLTDILDYRRVPITAEKAPDWCDFDEIRNLITTTDLSKTALVVNCQIGLGRSTLGTIIATLVTKWIKQDRTTQHNEHRGKCQYLNYQIINSLLRVIKNGLEVKSAVDNAIDKCGAFLNLREIIESEHVKAEEEETDENKRQIHIKRAISALQRYFVLICFEGYLQSTSPESLDSTETFQSWMNRHSEIGTLLLEFNNRDERLIVPVEKSISEGVALSSEIMDVVASRHGQVLSQQTILKQDAFPGCQRINLKEKIEGAYNFRRIPVKEVKRSVKFPLKAADEGGLAADLERPDDADLSPPFICGCGMPSKNAIKSVLKSMQAGPGGKRRVLWTCLREEPVLYVNGLPYVLRLFQEPYKNLESTGITTDRVESVEDRMKLDAINECRKYNEKLLLHDEKPNEKGEYELMGLWETISIDEIETPKEVFQSIKNEGYQVDYLRIPITDEQAPIPDVFDELICRTRIANKGVDVIYNCQMGRGRTTTGMVTACLMAMIMNNEHLIIDNDGIISVQSPVASRTSLFDGVFNSETEDFVERSYHDGEFKIILQLVSILTYGKLAKRLADKAINICDHMQNLRRAIYDYKLHLNTIEDHNSKQYKSIREVALNYLIRYFYLIVFANYLLEELSATKHMNDNDQNKQNIEEQEAICNDRVSNVCSFKNWLEDRREITNILTLKHVDLD
ncbi:inositol hexakisphosphate-domain-containing protein [Mycotypha africana]|uniref:inositol hexakisphosphate-domain-containing protein n=1 Tax=Mycotypha africana TaxID=64632 RepID=UPI0023000DB4|nr:inositol hexakisphosphate-domain-containing protein [Mycotypha africana]KAI8971777.1 inositol hexakisphosphate-domain-containing protein [Mycotypha africana]